ncbi:MAG: PilZ domain-containing protein [Arenimonas sp.]|nr:PilZ domain-containing protein [Arenimonas sp.]MBP6310113.1 PilZ domain-containing protein [Arenimonas sp.]
MNDEIRRLKRRKSEQLIKVTDAMTLTPLGLVADLSESGMMIITSTLICPDALYQCELIFPRSINILAPIKIGVQELWSETNVHNGQHMVGFRFIDISIEDRIQIRNWVNEPGSTYS